MTRLLRLLGRCDNCWWRRRRFYVWRTETYLCGRCFAIASMLVGLTDEDLRKLSETVNDDA